MNCIFKEMRRDEYYMLEDFLYQAIFVPPWYGKEIPCDIIYTYPKLYVSIDNFGSRSGDRCIVAQSMTGRLWERCRCAQLRNTGNIE